MLCWMRYWSGFFTGVAALTLLAMMAFCVLYVPDIAMMYDAFGAPGVPATTRIALSPIWAMGTLGLLTGALLIANQWRTEAEKTRAIAIGVVASTSLVVTLFTMWAAYAPVSGLADSISGY